MKKRIIKKCVMFIITFVFFALLNWAGMPTFETLARGMRHILIDSGFDRDAAEFISEALVIFASADFSEEVVEFFAKMIARKFE